MYVCVCVHDEREKERICVCLYNINNLFRLTEMLDSLRNKGVKIMLASQIIWMAIMFSFKLLSEMYVFGANPIGKKFKNQSVCMCLYVCICMCVLLISLTMRSELFYNVWLFFFSRLDVPTCLWMYIHSSVYCDANSSGRYLL